MPASSSERLTAPYRALLSLILPVLVAVFSQPAQAGLPFLTDDPEPTELGHWEIFGPLIEAEGRGAEIEGATAIEINYGAGRDLQLTMALPVAWSHDQDGWRGGAGDIEVAVKYRFIHDEAAGFQIAAFPGITIPTGSNGLGAGRVTALLPVWAQQDLGNWSIFGGAGYAINPGAGNRNYWTGGVAVTNQINERVLLGVEVDRQGADVVGGAGSTSLGLGMIYQLKQPFRVLMSAGPTFEDNTGRTSYHATFALGIDF